MMFDKWILKLKVVNSIFIYVLLKFKHGCFWIVGLDFVFDSISHIWNETSQHKKERQLAKSKDMDSDHVEDIPVKNGRTSDLGEPIQIVKINDEGDHSFFLDEEALSNIMEDERIRDKPLCIVSVAGE